MSNNKQSDRACVKVIQDNKHAGKVKLNLTPDNIDVYVDDSLIYNKKAIREIINIADHISWQKVNE